MRAYKTRFWLWFAMSVAMFVALGFIVRVIGKGTNRSFYDVVSYWFSELHSGHAGSDVFAYVAMLLTVWLALATVFGWLLQRVVIVLFQHREKSKPSD